MCISLYTLFATVAGVVPGSSTLPPRPSPATPGTALAPGNAGLPARAAANGPSALGAIVGCENTNGAKAVHWALESSLKEPPGFVQSQITISAAPWSVARTAVGRKDLK